MNSPAALIETRDLRKDYVLGDNVVHALAGVSMTIEAGEFVAVMGPSGSGKSTFMNMIGCLDSPSGGEYWLNGFRVSELADDELARIRNKEIGFVFQTFNLLPRATALHNVELPLVYAGIGAKARVAKATEALRQVGLADRMHHRPNELSGGQRQRVAIARATIMRPALLLADEPTGNLDRATGEEGIRLLEQLNADGVTLLMVTHDSALGARAARRLLMEDGAIRHDESRAAAALRDAHA